MDDEKQDSRGADETADDELAVDRPSARRPQEVDRDLPPTDPDDVGTTGERTIRAGFNGLRGMPIIPPDLVRGLRKSHEDLARTMSRVP
jgi:hypothetical protein